MSIRPLTPELAEKARVELNEDPKRITSDLQSIKDWLAKQPHIYARTDDQWLIAFLRGCKYSLERTKEKLDLYYTLRTIAPELHTFRHDDPKFDEIMDSGAENSIGPSRDLQLRFSLEDENNKVTAHIISTRKGIVTVSTRAVHTYAIMPKTATPDSPRLTIMRSGKIDPERITVTDMIGMGLIIQKIQLMEDDNAVVSGIHFLLDVQGITMAHMLQMTPSIMKKASVQSQDAAPIRLKGAHYINCSPAFEKLINAMKSMLNEKNRKRLFVYGTNYDSLYEQIPKSLLPAEYGGDGGPIREITDAWKAKRRQYSAWLEDDMKYKTDESKRPGKPKTAESMFGIDGSFRQLEFD